MNRIDEIWLNIVTNENQDFITVTGLHFKYKVKDNGIMVFRDNKFVGRLLTKKNFEKALEFEHFYGSEFSNTVIGSSYVRSLLSDPRISG